MVASLFAASALLAGTQASTEAHITSAAANSTRPWYVNAASDQIVQLCWLGGSFGMGGGYTLQGPTASTLYFSSYYTETYETDTATTLYTTVPGSVVTLYGPDPNKAASATVTDAVDNIVNGGSRRHHRAVQAYAHDLAEAIVAPSTMTAVIESAYSAIMENGYIPAATAAQLVSQASVAFQQLKTDPAYSNQRQNLLAHPTAPVDLQKAVNALSSTHSAGIAQVTAHPEGAAAVEAAKALGQQFVNEFLRN